LKFWNKRNIALNRVSRKEAKHALSNVEGDAKISFDKKLRRGGDLCELSALGAINFLNSICETIPWLVTKNVAKVQAANGRKRLAAMALQ
jgi:hypothetical protein